MTSTHARPDGRHPVLMGLAVMLLAANLQPALASVGPVLVEIRQDLALSGTQAAFLASAGVVCLGLLAPVAVRPARRWGIDPVLGAALAALLTGLVARVAGGPVLLLVGTTLACGAIAVANVLLPALIKRDFPGRTGLMMGLYTMTLSGSAAVAAGATVPLGERVGAGWRGALLVWAVPAALALLVWAPFMRRRTSAPGRPRRGPSLVRERLAWQVTGFFGLQSLGFYALLTWLPTFYRDHGYSAAVAGVMLSAVAVVQAVAGLVVPPLAGRSPDQRVFVAGAVLVTAAGLAGLLVAPMTWPYAWVTLLGLGQGAVFALALSLIVWRAPDAAVTQRLSAMTQTTGYLIAAAGPLLLGGVHDLTGSWDPALGLLLVLLLLQLVLGVLAGRPGYVGHGAPRPATPADVVR